MEDKNKTFWRDKLTHSMAKAVIPMSIHYAYKMFSREEGDVQVSSSDEFRDSRNLMYKIYYYDLFKKILSGDTSRHNFSAHHPMREALDLAFTLIDSDGAYEELLKDLYVEQEKYFWFKFKSENFQIEHK